MTGPILPILANRCIRQTGLKEGRSVVTDLPSDRPSIRDATAHLTMCFSLISSYRCPTGKSSDKTSCDDGEYAGEGFTRCFPCNAGFTCKAGASVPNPPGQICPEGQWCDGKDAFDCPSGTYNDAEGGKSLGERSNVFV